MNKINKLFLKGGALGALCLMLTSCSTYSSKFNCAESKGIPCEMLRAIDKKIDSGEIDKAYKIVCKGAKCKKEESFKAAVLPKGGPIKAVLSIPSEEDEEVVISSELLGPD